MCCWFPSLGRACERLEHEGHCLKLIIYIGSIVAFGLEHVGVFLQYSEFRISILAAFMILNVLQTAMVFCGDQFNFFRLLTGFSGMTCFWVGVITEIIELSNFYMTDSMIAAKIFLILIYSNIAFFYLCEFLVALGLVGKYWKKMKNPTSPEQPVSNA